MNLDLSALLAESGVAGIAIGVLIFQANQHSKERQENSKRHAEERQKANEQLLRQQSETLKALSSMEKALLELSFYLKEQK